jgi:hypothetical protein
MGDRERAAPREPEKVFLMSKLFVSVCILVVCICLGCGPAETDRPAANAANNQASEIAKVSSPDNSSVSNTSGDPVSANSTPGSPIGALRKKRLKDIQPAAGDPAAEKPDLEVVLKGSERPAPEDSLFAVALLDNVVERRTFLKHPTLKMVEKVTTNDGRSSLKVVTRDGRSFDLDGNSIGPVSTAASFTILRAIGLEAPVVDRKRRPSTEAKKN